MPTGRGWRQVALCRHSSHAVTEAAEEAHAQPGQPWQLIPFDAAPQAHGLRECALGGGGGHARVPAWLEKWTALVLEFVEEEQGLLPAQLLALPRNLAAYTPASAAAEAKGAELPSAVLCQPTFPREACNWPSWACTCPDRRWRGCAACVGVSDNRLQNIVITLDKVKLCLHKSGNTCKPPLRLLSDEEVTDYLWTGEQCPSHPAAPVPC